MQLSTSYRAPFGGMGGKRPFSERLNKSWGIDGLPRPGGAAENVSGHRAILSKEQPPHAPLPSQKSGSVTSLCQTWQATLEDIPGTVVVL